MAKSAVMEERPKSAWKPTMPSLRRAVIVLEGMKPGLLVHGQDLEGSAKKGTKRSPEDECEARLYHTEDGQLAFKWISFYNSLCRAAEGFKWKGQKSFKQALLGCVTCDDELVSLGTKAYRMRQDYARIPPKKGAMVMIARPEIFPWKARLQLTLDDERFQVDRIPEIFSEAGRFVGLGAWRPQLGGVHGKFVVAEWIVQA